MNSTAPKTRSLALVLLPAALSLVFSVILSLVTGNPLGLLFGLLMPLMLVVPVFEGIAEKRRGRAESKALLLRRCEQFLSPTQILERGAGRVPTWRVHGETSTSATTPALFRIGEDGVTGEPVLHDASFALNVIGNPTQLGDVLRALRCSARWSVSSDLSATCISDVDAGARWLLIVRANAQGTLIDRHGELPPRHSIALDSMSVAEESQFLAHLARFRQSGELHHIVWDLVRDGPHAVVSGVTGSGKTVFLRRWIEHLVTHYREQVTIGVIDFKGGGGFVDLRQAGLVRHLATNTEPRGVALALAGIEAMMLRRAELLARHGCSDISELPAVARTKRVVIVVDEYRALLEQHPESRSLLVDVASRGRALGVHLILATQRFASHATDELLSNCGIRIAFRAGDETESTQLIASRAACDSSLQPGEGFVSWPGHPARRFKLSAPTPIVQTHSPSAENEALWLEPSEAVTWASNNDSPGLQLGLSDNHQTLCREVVKLKQPGELIIVVGGDHSERENLMRLMSHQSQVALISADGVMQWDALSRVEITSGLALSDVDHAQQQLPVAWREPFEDLLLSTITHLVGAGQFVCVSLAASNAMLARLRQVKHSCIECGESQGAAARQADTEFVPFRAPVSCGVALAQETTVALTAEPADGGRWLLITGFPHLWRNVLTPNTEIVTSDDVMFARVVPTEFSRVFVEGCSPHEVRSLRLSPVLIPPPHPGTLIELAGNGQWHRVLVASRTTCG